MSAAVPGSFSIALDARRWGRTGLGRYQSELYRHLRREAPHAQLTLVGGPAHQAAELGAACLPFTAPLYSPQEQWLGGRAMARARASVYHFPHYSVPRWAPRPYVVTVHDLIHFTFPQDFGMAKVAVARHVLRRAVARAAKVICVSASTARDLAALAPASAGKAVVIGEGVSDLFRPASRGEVDALRARHRLDRFVLSMGDRAPHKRFDVVANAFRWLRERDEGLRLVVVGERGAGAAPPDPEGTLRLDYVSDAELRVIYSAASCLLFPSAYEGFGLPPLEAMACGCPVVCSRGSSLDEVCGGAAVQVDGANWREVGEAAWALLADEGQRQQWVAAGLTHGGRFSWTDAARRTLAVLHEAAGQ